MKNTTKLFQYLFEGIEDYSLDAGYVFRGVPKPVAVSYAEGKYVPTSLNEQMPFDPVVVEMMLGEDYSEMSQEDVDYQIQSVCPWYDGSAKSVKGGVNTTSDLDRAIDYAGDNGYVLVLELVSDNFCDFDNSYIYVKSVNDIKLKAIYEVETGKEYTPSEFLGKAK